MNDRYAPARTNLATARREIHRAWFLTWRIPVAAWHLWRANRLQALADQHRTTAKRTSQRALELSQQHPSLYWKNR